MKKYLTIVAYVFHLNGLIFKKRLIKKLLHLLHLKCVLMEVNVKMCVSKWFRVGQDS